MKNFMATLIGLSLVQLSGCSDNFMSSKVKDQRGTKIDLPVQLDAEGNYTASMDPAAGSTQVMRASLGTVAGSAIAMPPGALSIPVQVTIGEGASLTSASSASQLGIASSSLSAAGPSVSFIPSTSVEASSPFTLSIPLSTLASFALDNASINPNHLVIVYKSLVVENGTSSYQIGIMPRNELTVGASSVQFQTKRFGTFQLAVTETLVSTKIDKPTVIPPVLKSSVPPPVTLTYGLLDATYTVGSSITSNTPTVTGGKPDTFKISPELPAGLSLNSLSGAITGTPTAVSSLGTYIVVAENQGGSVQTELKVTVNAAPVITVAPPAPLTTVTNVTTSTGNGTFGVGQVIMINVTFSNAVVVTGVPQLLLETGTSDATATYVSGTGSNVLAFTYAVAAGESAADLDYVSSTSLVLNGSTISSSTGTAANLTLPTPGAAGSLGANQNVVIDTVVATILAVSSSSTNGTYGVSAVITINVTFSGVVNVVGSPKLLLETGATDAFATYSSGDGSNVLAFLYTVAAGHTSSDLDYGSSGSLSLNGGTIKISSGADANLALPAPGTAGSLGANKAIVINTNSPPTITGIGSQTTLKNQTTSPISFTISDTDASVACNSSSLSLSSTDQTLVTTSGSVTWSGTAPSCTATITPVANAVGTVSLAIHVTDSMGATTPSAFLLNIVGPIVLGQASAVTNANLEKGMTAPTSSVVVGTKLFVADSANNRVLVWNTIPTTLHQPPSFALGQPDLYSSAANRGGSPSALTLKNPSSVHSDGSRLFIADTGNSRVLIWTTIPTSSSSAAHVVLGQLLMTDGAQNRGSSPGANTLSSPVSVFGTGSSLYVADQENHRVLHWSLPTTDGANANKVLGQANFTNSAINAGGSVSNVSLNYPSAVHVVGTTLFVSDKMNNRVMAWSTSAASGDPASFVLGQPNFSSSAINSGGLSASSLSFPHTISSSGTKLFVADTGNHRVLGWNTIPGTTNQAANFALGQPNFTTNTLNASAALGTSLNSPKGVFSIGSQLFVADSSNNRVLIWNTLPTASGQTATFALGQPSLTSKTLNNPAPTNLSLNQPSAVLRVGTKLYVADTLNNRVLGWNSIPTFTGQPADFVLGQADLTSNLANRGGTISASSLNQPRGLASNGAWLFVADTFNNRILVWNSLPSGDSPATNVLGQTTMFNSGGAATQTGLNKPSGIHHDGTNLYVADSSNNRVLIWTTPISGDGQPASIVLGQSSFNSFSPNIGSGTPGLNSLSNPTGVFTTNNQLFVADSSNNRVLKWSPLPSGSYTPADVVIGQPSSADYTAATSASGMNGPQGIAVAGLKLLVSEVGSNRITVRNTIPAANGTFADSVIGQASNLTSAMPNNGGLSIDSLSSPHGIFHDGQRLYIADKSNNRVVITPYP